MKAEWALKELQYVIHNYLDGVNIDFEQTIVRGSKQSAALTEWTRYLAELLRFYVPGSQVCNDR